MAQRKTIEVAWILDKANHYLATTTVNEGLRRGVASLLETILHETGNYAGFGPLTETQVPAGQKPGIRYYGLSDIPEYGYEPGQRFFDCDDSRRCYIKHRKL